MDIFFHDPTDIPLPPQDVRIRKLAAEPWPDGKRVRVTLELTPFLQRPNSVIQVVDSHGREAASLDIIETMDPRLEFTVHLRGSDLESPFTVSAVVFYLETPGKTPENPDPEPDLSKRIIVDRAETLFKVSQS